LNALGSSMEEIPKKKRGKLAVAALFPHFSEIEKVKRRKKKRTKKKRRRQTKWPFLMLF